MRFLKLLILVGFSGSAITYGMTFPPPDDEPSGKPGSEHRGKHGGEPPSLPLVFQDDFESGSDRWETTDSAAWTLNKTESGQAFGLNRRKSDYQPEFRSPHNIALIKELELSYFDIRFKVKSTKDTGGHRDCCVFFCHENAAQFYYVHLGAVPDPHSGQIMVVNKAARKALTNNERKTPWDDNWHNVRLTRDSKTGSIKVYFDDFSKPHMQIKDQTFKKGRIGIGSFDDMNDFDDVEVYGR